MGKLPANLCQLINFIEYSMETKQVLGKLLEVQSRGQQSVIFSALFISHDSYLNKKYYLEAALSANKAQG